jgi:YD repeat-containing protein
MTRFSVDNLNRTTAATDPLGGQTVFSYDENSNLRSLTDALNHATSYTYDTSDASRNAPIRCKRMRCTGTTRRTT